MMFVAARILLACEQRSRLHDLAGLAVTALRHLQIHPGLLQRMVAIGRVVRSSITASAAATRSYSRPSAWPAWSTLCSSHDMILCSTTAVLR
jgi:hypothetical protein